MSFAVDVVYNTLRENCFRCKLECSECRIKVILDKIEVIKINEMEQEND